MTVPVVFAHGLSGSPNGNKAILLKKHFDAIAPALQTLELPQQAQALCEAMPPEHQSILIGSSLGALASLGAAQMTPERIGFLILLAPAFDLAKHRETFSDALVQRPGLMDDAPRYATLLPPHGMPCHVVQGMEDELFQIDKAIVFTQRVATASLTLVHANHQLDPWVDNLVPLVKWAMTQMK